MFEESNYKFQYKPYRIMEADSNWKLIRNPVLRRMKDGTLICTSLSGGPTEPHNENVVLITRSIDDGNTWSKPEIMFKHSKRGVWATEIFTEGENPCIFVHTYNAESHYNELKTFRSFSYDNGKTWSDPVSVPNGITNVSVWQGIVLENKDWLFPVYWQETRGRWDEFYVDHPFCCGVMISKNKGKTFSLYGDVKSQYSLWEPNVIEIEPGKLVMLIRAECSGYLSRSESKDGGLTWIAPFKTDIPNPGTKLCLVKIGNIQILLNNPSEKPGWENRNKLALWVSRDGLKTWDLKIDLCEGIPGNVICYPHAYVDYSQELLYIACDTAKEHFLIKVPFRDFV